MKEFLEKMVMSIIDKYYIYITFFLAVVLLFFLFLFRKEIGKLIKRITNKGITISKKETTTISSNANEDENNNNATMGVSLSNNEIITSEIGDIDGSVTINSTIIKDSKIGNIRSK